VVEAPSGEEAMRLLERQKPDLILMDLQLPGVDGLSLTRRIKAIRAP
jgi:CheY-like chemotaxis protein